MPLSLLYLTTKGGDGKAFLLDASEEIIMKINPI